MSLYNLSSGYEPSSSTSNNVRETQVNCLDNTAILTDNLSLMDVLEILKDRVRVMATELNRVDQYLSLIKKPTEPTTHSEVLKVKQNIINNITYLLKDMRPLDYPIYQSLCSVNLLKMYEKVSSECKLLLNNIQHDDDNIKKRVEKFNKLTTFIADFQQEVDSIVAQNTLNEKVENAIVCEFNECKSDLYELLSKVDPSSMLKEILSLLLENRENDDDSWVDIEDMPYLSTHCEFLKKNGFVLQCEQNKYLFKLSKNV